VVGLAAGGNVDSLASQAARYRPAIVALSSSASVERLRAAGGASGAAVAPPGREGLVAVASHPEVDLVLCASSGTDALEAVLAAIECRKTIALANKEVLVMAGGIVTAAAARHGVAILPVDSEHNAIHQCLHGRRHDEIARLVLTASGGPFRGRAADDLHGVTAADALRHPTWRMGRKITIDSATMMNKGLEVIEAHWLFGVAGDRISVVIHPQSVVHSMVELADGSVIAQLGVTDMRLPIQYAFSYPERWQAPLPPLDLVAAGRLEFETPDRFAFPCLSLAYRALHAEKSVAVVLNAANEIAVARFLENRLRFTDIPRLIERTMDAHDPIDVTTIAEVRAVDAWARTHAEAAARLLELSV
ncbi:MAG TPA: 1-deoxy-D-xylulose-5-phosphate reductoisomerase, partial [Vicinamibacterales bacterium]|nr:1-deoxy-D-xylulose-5-phosphate reductoisomerase [Vicinamibacterales bacterium]